MDQAKIQYSVVVPVFNGEKTLEELTVRLRNVLREMGTTYELIFVDDNSSDKSWDVIHSMREKHAWIRGFRLSRNYGQQNATMCGLKEARGEFIITLDDDLQNPPEEIPALIAEIQNGYDVVFGVNNDKKHPKYRLLGSRIINKFYAWTFNTQGRVSAFRILRRDLVERILDYDLNYTYINGLIAWYTKRVSQVEVEHEVRSQGRSGYNLKKLFALSLNMITNFSLLPLQIASISGLLFVSIGFIMGAFFAVKRLFFGSNVSGFTAIIASISFFSGMILFCLGIIGEYLGRIHLNINRKPQYSIRERDEDTTESQA